MSAHITVIGTVATDPKSYTFDNGASKCTFRLAEHERRFDRVSGNWIDSQANWYTVSASKQLGENVLCSLRKGQRVLVSGRLKIRNWQNQEGRQGTTVEVEAEGIGPDLRFGTAKFLKKNSARKLEPSEQEKSENINDLDLNSNNLLSSENLWVQPLHENTDNLAHTAFKQTASVTGAAENEHSLAAHIDSDRKTETQKILAA